MVHYPPTVEHIGSASSPVISRPALSGSSTSSKPGEAASDGLEAERARFLDQGCSQKEVETLLPGQKAYHQQHLQEGLEKFFFTFAQQQGWDSASPSACQILEFLQSGLENGLGSKFKCQPYPP